MLKKVLFAAVVPLCLVSLAHADFQYQSTSRVTGGALIQMMRFVPGGGALKEPQVSTVAVSGNRLVRRSKRQGEIIDLDKRTITTINFEKRTYTEMTFEQMKQMLEQMSASVSQQQQQQPQGDQKVNLDFDADVKDTGQTKTISGMEAHQVVMTMTMSAADPQSGQAGAMKMNSEMWLVKDVPGAREMREFYARMAKELDWAPTGMGGMMNRPDINRAMAKMMAQGEKMDGTPVEQIMRIGGTVTGVGADQQSTQQAQAPPARPSVSDALGSALGGKLGGFGGFGKKKKQDADADAAGKDAAASGQAPGQASGSLIEMTIESTGFSTGAVDGSLFSVPADFKKVEEAQPGGRRK